MRSAAQCMRPALYRHHRLCGDTGSHAVGCVSLVAPTCRYVALRSRARQGSGARVLASTDSRSCSGSAGGRHGASILCRGGQRLLLLLLLQLLLVHGLLVVVGRGSTLHPGLWQMLLLLLLLLLPLVVPAPLARHVRV